MPVIANQVSVAAGAANPNLIAGSAFEIARVQSIVSIGIAASASGGFCTITSGPDLVAEEFPPPVIGIAANNPSGAAVTTTSQYPIVPDQMYFTDVMNPLDRLVIKARNPTAGAIVFAFVVQITPTGK